MAIDRVATLRNAEKLLRQGRLDPAIAEYVRLVEDQPTDWNTANALGDLYLRGGYVDKAVEQFTRIADSLDGDGFWPRAAAVYKKILKVKPNDEHALIQAAGVAVKQGLLLDARAYLNAVCAERRQRGDLAGLAEAMIRLAAVDPGDHQARMAAARARVEIGDIAGAVRDLKALAVELFDLERYDQAVVALREATHFDPFDREVHELLARVLAAQGDAASRDESRSLVFRLCDEAVIGDDWHKAAAVLKEWLTATPHDISILHRLVEVCVDGNLKSEIVDAQAQLADAYLAAGSAADARLIAEDLVARHPADARHIERLRHVLTVVGEKDPDAIIASRVTDSTPETDWTPEPAVTSSPQDLETVFAQLREEAASRLHADAAGREFTRGMALYQAGVLGEALPLLETASRAPRHRFEAAAAVGRIRVAQGDLWSAIEWLERAAEAPAPTPADSHRLLYDLADALEAAGETARALAICLELRADAGDYQDVAARVDRLSKVQARG